MGKDAVDINKNIMIYYTYIYIYFNNINKQVI